MTTALVYSTSPAASQVTDPLNEAVELVPDAKECLERNDQSGALSRLQAAFNALNRDVIKLNGLIATVCKAKREATDKESTQRINDELNELKVELDAALAAVPPEAAVIGHGIFILDLFEV